MRPGNIQVSAAVGIRIDISYGVGAKLVGMRLHPFRRSDQPRFLRIPRAINNRPLGFPSFFGHLPQHPRLFHLRGNSGNGILRSVHPGIVMVPANHPLVRLRSSRNSRDHIVDLLHVPIEFQPQMHLRRPWPQVIGNRQPSAPPRRRHRSRQSRQQWLRFRIRNGLHRNFCEDPHIFDLQPLGIRRRSHSRSERIAWIKRHVHHAPALHALGRTPRPPRVNVSGGVTVIAWVGVNQAAHRAVLESDFGFDASPGRAITRDDDRPFYGNAHAPEFFVILGDPVVDVNQRRRHLAVNRIGVVRRQLLILLVRGRIFGNRRLPQLGYESRRLDHLEHTLLRRGEKNLKRFHVHVPAPLLEFRRQPFLVVLIVGRADVVRPRRQQLHVIANIVRRNRRAEFLLPLPFCARIVAREACQAGLRVLLRQKRPRNQTQCRQCDETPPH